MADYDRGMTLTLNQQQELLERAKQLNVVVENSYLTLACVLSEIYETETYKATGFDTFEDYIQQELNRSKSVGSKLKKVGDFIRASKFQPETLDTSYVRLYQAINLLPEAEPERVLAVGRGVGEDSFRLCLGK